MDNIWTNFVARINSASFTTRFITVVALALGVGVSNRYLPVALPLLVLLLAAFVWMLAKMWAWRHADGGSALKANVIRVAMGLLALPLVAALAFGAGNSISVAVIPLSAEEVARFAEYEAQREAQQRADAAKKEIEAAEAIEQQKREAAVRVAEANAEAEKAKAAAELAKAEAEKAKADAAVSAANTELSNAQGREVALNGGTSNSVESTIDKNQNPLGHVEEFCRNNLSGIGVSVPNYVSVDQDGKHLFLTTVSEYELDGMITYECIKAGLEFSGPLIGAIESTSALMGQQTWSENNNDFKWFYHPDTGLNLSIRHHSCFLFFCD